MATGWSRTNARTSSVSPDSGRSSGDVVRVLHEPDVEDEVRLERHAVLEPEADELEGELVGPDVGGQRGEQPLAELAQRQVRGVEDDVRLAPDGVEPAALLGDRAGDPALVAERMAVAGLAEPPDQDVVARLEEDDPRPDPAALERAAHRRQRERRVAGPDVEDDRHAREPLAIGRDELGQVGQQLTGQVVDDGVAEVLEQLGGGRLAAAGQPADDHDGRLGHGVRRCARVGLAGHRPLRLMNRIVSSYRRYIVPPRTNGLTRSPPGVATAEKIAMPRITIRREDASRSEVTMPTRDSPTRRIGNSMTRPNARNIVVTKSKYGPAADQGCEVVVVKLNRNVDRVRQDEVGDDDAEGEEEQRHRDPRPDGLALGGVRPGEMNAQSW